MRRNMHREQAMPIIVVANPKGGVGKSTLATNIAGYFARQGLAVMLGDIDRQQSAARWLALRPRDLPPIQTWEIKDGEPARPPKGVTHAVLDTPAGIKLKNLLPLLRNADRVLVPSQPSPFDIAATGDFLKHLNLEMPASMRNGKVALVGVRVDERTRSADQFKAFCASIRMPPEALLRSTQNYLHLAAHGMTLWDVTSGRVEKDLVQWQPLVRWLNG
jgi:chromosome partitioning protein